MNDAAQIPQEAMQYGFITDGLGAHSSRTIMLVELRLLLSACAPTVDLGRFRSAVIEENVLLKRTEATRKESFRRLRELYGLNPNLLLFRALRDLWDQKVEAQPLLALLCAVGRDPTLRATAGVVLDVPTEAIVTAQMIAKAVDEEFPGRLNPTTLANIGRHAASSWTQSGHLRGRTKKVRSRAESDPTSVAYALFAGYLCGQRGDALFHTLWAHLLDTPTYLLQEKAAVASQQGWLEYRHAGGITDISFRHLLREGKNEQN